VKLFVCAISVENEYAGRVLDVSWLLAKGIADAEKQVKAHCKKTFKNGKEWGEWTDLEVSVEEVPSKIDNYAITVALAEEATE
jgi:hypothetical protein